MSLKLIVALDFDNEKTALDLVDQLDSQHCALKVGSELFTLLGPQFIKQLVARNFKVFLDLKFHDIPNTVAKACHSAADLGVWMMNVHASGGSKMLEAAKTALDTYGKDRPLLIAVTILTSFSENDLIAIGVNSSLMDQVKQLAKLSKQSGLDGVVCSAHESVVIQQICGEQFLTVTPGIRLPSDSLDDQSRVMTPSQAIQAGSHYLVIGRPITRAENPSSVVSKILKDIS
ncbi:orotidine-5'-phosphate decarboxylase [Legionella waltersii]|uniref:Orotidine 5'-phosphate decarboxylase n=1 Tax=Legionella waltersii TaxID=66969 RepID=A0A0W1ALS8_9GAMM|nr:orotidine-5'-phosphate decarboxylase [Legionella waltersii]KTD82276.1 orotidine 5'-phosphate decarboxylase [Legionella waltersii]SNV04325.1 orotidine-5'-phosphate decarboxylase [Legionella waltersii]